MDETLRLRDFRLFVDGATSKGETALPQDSMFREGREQLRETRSSTIHPPFIDDSINSNRSVRVKPM